MTATPTITIRRLAAEDAAAIRELHAEMDQRDSIFRFFTPAPKHLDKVADAIARDDSTHGAVGAFLDARLVGVANFVTLSGTRAAEVALVVAHDVQEHGIGTALLHQLAALARERRIERFVADVMPSNSKMMRLIIDADFPVTAHREDGIARVSVHL
ncbi:GNAT family N-acetyltransferase [Nocardia anaemiae]|uniref:GNAT family N-acetyltransferase n=1 Tax=Nocardia anaemiae TaxID=263910 RepID=UPI0007A50F37|nr:GNAT family N-acetyltransferase [Nocardia anaemiae]